MHEPISQTFVHLERCQDRTGVLSGENAEAKRVLKTYLSAINPALLAR